MIVHGLLAAAAALPLLAANVPDAAMNDAFEQALASPPVQRDTRSAGDPRIDAALQAENCGVVGSIDQQIVTMKSGVVEDSADLGSAFFVRCADSSAFLLRELREKVTVKDGKVTGRVGNLGGLGFTESLAGRPAAFRYQDFAKLQRTMATMAWVAPDGARYAVSAYGDPDQGSARERLSAIATKFVSRL